MHHAAFIIGAYVGTFGAVAALAWRVVSRGRALARQLPDEDKPWA
jgi:heme exporter protein CcmD